MHDHIKKYTEKLLRDRTAAPDSIRFYRLDDVVTANQRDEWLPLFSEVFSGLNVTALLFAKPALPFADLLVERSDAKADRLVPNDSETRVFLHDIPFIRTAEWTGRPASELAAKIIGCLKERKAAVIQGLGIVATGGVTVEQAYIGFSTVFHTTFVKYLLDLLTDGFMLPDEQGYVDEFRSSWLRQPDLSGLAFTPGPLETRAAGRGRAAERQMIYDEICRVGRYTVEKGYVDSFFGNISYFDGRTIYISQTTSSLDELEGHIDPVPMDGSSTAGLSASSELPAHRGVYLATDYHAILHGHPKFSVIMSMYCEEEDCEIRDCNRYCNRKRSVCGVPIVSGETGAGGLANSVPLAIKDSGVCIVYGHGIFAAAEKDFQQAFMNMAHVEDRCREGYFDLLVKNSDFKVQRSK
jgi:ribulose-5-phosphate 4-epimerase/fuculose-1-phosphate aldolase